VTPVSNGSYLHDNICTSISGLQGPVTKQSTLKDAQTYGTCVTSEYTLIDNKDASGTAVTILTYEDKKAGVGLSQRSMHVY